MYFNLASYGKNIEGVTAASWLSFRKPPATLQWTEAIALAITPKSPNAYRPGRFPGAAQQHCRRLAEQLRQRGKIAEADWWFIDCTRPPGQLRALPHAAPHPLARLHSGAGRNSRLVLQDTTTAPAHGYAVRTTIVLTCSGASSRPSRAICVTSAGRVCTMRQYWSLRMPQARSWPMSRLP